MTPHFSPIVRAGDLFFLSGQMATDEQLAVHGDVVAQTRRVLANLLRILQTQELTLLNVVKATVWLRHAQDFAAFNATYADVFGAHRPARSTVVCDLALPSALVEIEFVAQRVAST